MLFLYQRLFYFQWFFLFDDFKFIKVVFFFLGFERFFEVDDDRGDFVFVLYGIENFVGKFINRQININIIFS